jgi:UDP-glucose:(heptosyl)LPS alpha-1,3-glucosyltransferase
MKLIVLPNSAFFNHSQNLRFSHDARRVTVDFDVVVGFNKLPYLDVLFCADPASRQPATFLQGLYPRIRGYRALDLACFGENSITRVLLLSEPQWTLYHQIYNTDPSRVEILPPMGEETRTIPLADRAAVRALRRQELGISADSLVWLFVAGYPAAKGLDRIIAAMSSLPDVQCLCVGFDLFERRHRELLRMARSAGVLSRLKLLRWREDIPELMAASDLLVHPSRKDVTATVILEALINGLPIVTTDVCGYAIHVSRAQAGLVVASDPFLPTEFQSALVRASDLSTRQRWQKNAISYVDREDMYSGLDRASSAIEEVGMSRKVATQLVTS